jgi:hypothetical protein
VVAHVLLGFLVAADSAEAEALLAAVALVASAAVPLEAAVPPAVGDILYFNKAKLCLTKTLLLSSVLRRL